MDLLLGLVRVPSLGGLSLTVTSLVLHPLGLPGNTEGVYASRELPRGDSRRGSGTGTTRSGPATGGGGVGAGSAHQ